MFWIFITCLSNTHEVKEASGMNNYFCPEVHSKPCPFAISTNSELMQAIQQHKSWPEVNAMSLQSRQN